MYKIFVSAVLLIVCAFSVHGFIPYGYYPPPPPPIGFLPIYSAPNNSHYMNNSYYGGANNTNSSRGGLNCLHTGHDLPGAHSLFVGCRTINDKLLFRESYVKAARWWSTREKTVIYPGSLPVGTVRTEKIYAIRCYDKIGNGKGGFASIVNGGIGFNHVTIRLYTEDSGKGFRYQVEIYGH